MPDQGCQNSNFENLAILEVGRIPISKNLAILELAMKKHIWPFYEIWLFFGHFQFVTAKRSFH